MNTQTFSRKLAIVLIVFAVFGTEISYHFTLESRFDAIEEKLQQDTTAMQQMQDSIDTLSSSKAQTLDGLNKQVAALQSSFEPLGKMSREQTDALSQVRQEIGALQQAQNEQIDAQKKLSSGIEQLEKAHGEARMILAAPTPAPTTATVAAVPSAAATPVTTPDVLPAPTQAVPAAAKAAPVSTPTASAASASTNAISSAVLSFPGAFSHPTKVAVTPSAANTSDAIDVRPIDSVSDTFPSVRALPVNSVAGR